MNSGKMMIVKLFGVFAVVMSVTCSMHGMLTNPGKPGYKKSKLIIEDEKTAKKKSAVAKKQQEKIKQNSKAEKILAAKAEEIKKAEDIVLPVVTVTDKQSSILYDNENSDLNLDFNKKIVLTPQKLSTSKNLSTPNKLSTPNNKTLPRYVGTPLFTRNVSHTNPMKLVLILNTAMDTKNNTMIEEIISDSIFAEQLKNFTAYDTTDIENKARINTLNSNMHRAQMMIKDKEDKKTVVTKK